MGDIEDLHIMQKKEQNDLLHRDIFNKQLLYYVIMISLYTYMSHSYTACTYTICKTTRFKSYGIFRALKL